jgi:hypothetical protein
VIEAMGMQSFVKICCIVSTPGSRGELPEIRLMISLEVGAERKLTIFRLSSGSRQGCRRFAQDAKLCFDAPFQKALWHQEQ